MPARAAEEEGFGLIELLFAMVMLNIGILTLVAAFQTGAVALARSSAVSNGAAVADKTMEIYRSLKSCQVFLNAPSGGGGDTTDSGGRTITNGIPSSASTTWYSQYFADQTAYGGPTINKFNYDSTAPQWVTNNTSYSGTYSGIPTTCSAPSGLPSGSPDPNKAVQYVLGPDGEYYPTFIYIVAVQPSGSTWTAGYVKQVTVSVFNPRKTTQMLARETSYFDPNVSG
jgi:type II secretory pathway pseudopilin PulG